MHQKINAQVQRHLDTGSLWMIGALATIAVAREGIETVIFFQALFIQSGETLSIFSALLGVGSAILLACVIFFSTRKVPVGSLFKGLSYILIFIAAGLVAHGIVELQGAQWLPTFIKPLYDLSSILPEGTGFGALLKAGFGYDANPSLIAVMGYVLYLGAVLTLFRRKAL